MDLHLRQLLTETNVRELAYWTCVGHIARSIGKCELQTLDKGAPVKGREWYAWNISPNCNQSSTQFWAKLIHSLYSERHSALVVERNGQLLVADSWSETQRVLVDTVYTGVTVDNLALEGAFPASTVLMFKASEDDVRTMTNLLYETYGKLLAYATRTYQMSRGRKGVLNIDSPNAVDVEKQNKEIAAVRKRFETFYGDADAVLPLYSGYTYTDLSGNKTYSLETTRDIRNMIDDVLTYDARAMGIPPALILGNATGIKDAMDSYLTFCIDPIADMISEEITRKRWTVEDVLAGSGARMDTSTIRHADIASMGTNIDKLIASGIYSANDIRAKLGEPRINEPWADQHLITKNYAPAAGGQGGGQDSADKT